MNAPSAFEPEGREFKSLRARYFSLIYRLNGVGASPGLPKAPRTGYPSLHAAKRILNQKPTDPLSCIQVLGEKPGCLTLQLPFILRQGPSASS